jgi:hypothetical protein
MNLPILFYLSPQKHITVFQLQKNKNFKFKFQISHLQEELIPL